MHCVDLGESFRTHIFLQNFVSIQPRTSPLKFAGDPLLDESGGPSESLQPALLGTALSTRGRSSCRRPSAATPTPRQRRPTSAEGGRQRRQRASVGKISAKCCSFSAVSAPIFARKYAFCSIFQSLPDHLADFFWQNLQILQHLQLFC